MGTNRHVFKAYFIHLQEVNGMDTETSLWAITGFHEIVNELKLTIDRPFTSSPADLVVAHLT